MSTLLMNRTITTPMFCFITLFEKIVKPATLLFIFLEYKPMTLLMSTLSMIRTITTPMFCFITSSEKKIVERATESTNWA